MRDPRRGWAVLGVWVAWTAFLGVLVTSFFFDSGWFLVGELLLAGAILGFSVMARRRAPAR